MRYGLWRRFKPRLVRPEPVDGRAYTVAQAEQAVWALLPKRKLTEQQLSEALSTAKKRAQHTGDAISLVTSLILQAPQAARAQEQMDGHKHGYQNKERRLYELIDFNDTFVSSILALPASELKTFTEQVKVVMDRLSKRANMRCFTNEQFDAIVHGLSREIAVYNGVRAEGFDVYMTSRTEDAFGVDMVVRDTHSGMSVGLDVKTYSAYYYRLMNLEREGRLSSDEVALAEQLGYVKVVNQRGEQKREVVLWRIDHRVLGEIRAFAFVSTKMLGREIAEILRRYGQP